MRLESELQRRGGQWSDLSRPQFLPHRRAERCNWCRQKHPVHNEASANAIRMNTELQHGKYHTVFLSSVFPEHEESIIDITMCLAKQKHQIAPKANTGCLESPTGGCPPSWVLSIDHVFSSTNITVLRWSVLIPPILFLFELVLAILVP